MANWAKLQEQLTGLPVVKRDKHSIHFAKGDGQIVANFSGKPCHYQDTGGIWKALDTAIVELEDGSLGAKGVPVRLNLNGLVRLINENNEDLYSQVTTRVGVFNFTTRNLVDYINLPVGQVQDDLLIKDTDLYSHTLRLTETGLREEIVIKSKPAFVTDKANLWLVLDTVVTGVSFEDGWLDAFEIAQMHFPPPTATDAEGREGTTKRYAKNIGGVQHLFTGLKFSELYRAAYPVTIDPDFTGTPTEDTLIRISNPNDNFSTSTELYTGKGSNDSQLYRSLLRFDLSSIPSGATVSASSLTVVCHRVASAVTESAVKVYRQLRDWVVTEATWNVYSTGNSWATAGGFNADDCEQTDIGSAAILDVGTYQFTLTAAKVQEWISGTLTNNGVLLRDPEVTNNTFKRFRSADYATEAYRPVLTVTYTAGSNDYTLTCAAGSYSLTGTNADLTVKRNYVLTCAAGSYSLTGSDISFGETKAYTLACSAGSYSLTGTDVTLTYTQGAQNFTLACEAGIYALTGTNAGLTSARTMACHAGSYTLTGTDATFNANYIFALGMGSYVLVGTACGLFILSSTPACRTATIEYENRTFAIPHEDRTATIEFENRTLEVKCH